MRDEVSVCQCQWVTVASAREECVNDVMLSTKMLR